MARSLNKVQLIGNLTKDPELRYTPAGRAVCTFSIATNRSWTTESGEKREEADFHRIVAWGKLGELCSQFLVKGRKVYVEGRLSTRSWQAQDGQQKSITEVVIDDMILLDSKGAPASGKAEEGSEEPTPTKSEPKAASPKKKEQEEDVPPPAGVSSDDDVKPEDIPF
jgi:single-strand DNA-binding protein